MSASPEAEALRRDLCFEDLEERFAMIASYALSAKEAAFRGSQHTLEVHWQELRLCAIAAGQTLKDLANPSPSRVSAPPASNSKAF
jgi:hypothetical protein